MAQNPNQQSEDLLDAITALTVEVRKSSESRTAETKSTASDTANIGKQRRRLLDQNNTLARLANLNKHKMSGVIKGMVSLHGVMGNVKDNTHKLVQSLAQAGMASSQMSSAVLETGKKWGATQTQVVNAMQDLVETGLTRFQGPVLKLATQMRVLGLSTRALLKNIAFNTQVLGMSEESSLALAKSMADTAVQFGIHMDALVTAMDSMAKDLVKSKAAFGQQTMESIQSAVMIMSGGRQELLTPLTDFVTSLTSGQAGFMKSMMLGSTFKQSMSPGDVIHQVMNALQEGSNRIGGVGVGPIVLEAFEKSHQFSADNLLLAEQMFQLSRDGFKTNMEAQARQVTSLSFEQAWQVATYDLQKRGMEVMMGVSTTLDTLGHGIAMIGVVVSLMGFLVMIVSPIIRLVGFLGKVGGLTNAIKTAGMSKGFLRGAKFVPGPGTKASTLANAVKAGTPLQMTTAGKVGAGAMGLGAVGGGALAFGGRDTKVRELSQSSVMIESEMNEQLKLITEKMTVDTDIRKDQLKAAQTLVDSVKDTSKQNTLAEASLEISRLMLGNLAAIADESVDTNRHLNVNPRPVSRAIGIVAPGG